VVASTNAHKVAEIAAMLERTSTPAGGVAPSGDAAVFAPSIRVIGLDRRADLPDVDEDRPDFAGNAALKAEAFARHLAAAHMLVHGALVLADDSGIIVDALDGAPGVRSARFAGPGATDAANNAAVVAALRQRGLARSPSHYECALALARVGGGRPPLHAAALGAVPHRFIDDTLIVLGRCDGELRVEARGSGGFGYDPHFWLDDGEQTMAELTREAKAARSHRGAALRALLAVIDLGRVAP
jgi:XTP/dITP diphosphohydrolase